MGFWSGVKSGFVGAAQGTWQGLKGLGNGAVDLATDSQARADAWNATVDAGRAVGGYASDVYSDPVGEFNQLRESAAGVYASADNFVRTADAEQWGELAGGGAFTVATIPVGGLAVKGAARAGAAMTGAARTGATAAAASVTRASAAVSQKAGKFGKKKPDHCERCEKTKASKTEPHIRPRKPHISDDVPNGFIDDNGDMNWEPKISEGMSDERIAEIEFAQAQMAKFPDGAVPGSKMKRTLDPSKAPGDIIIDRYSARSPKSDRGSYVSPQGVPYAQRSLPYVENPSHLRRFKVVEALDVEASDVGDLFANGGGGGVQYRMGSSIKDLIRDGKIIELTN